MGKRPEERATRSDKKRKTAPTIPLQLYEIISQLAYLLNGDDEIVLNGMRIGAKTVGEAIINAAIESDEVIEDVSRHFVRTLKRGDRVYFGDPDRERYKRSNTGHAERLRMHFEKDVAQRLDRLAYSLGCPMATATGLVLETAARNVKLVTSVIRRMVRRGVVDDRKVERIRILIGELHDMEALPAVKRRPMREIDGDAKMNRHGTQVYVDREPERMARPMLKRDLPL